MKVKVNLNDIEIPCSVFSYDAAICQSPKLILDIIGEVEIQGEVNVILRLPNGSMFQVNHVQSIRIYGYMEEENLPT